MALADFINKTGTGATGSFSCFALSDAGVVGSEIVTAGITQGIPNVKDSALAGSIEGKNLVLTANVAITEQTFVDDLAAQVNSTDVATSDYFFENSMNLPTTTGYATAKKVLVIHYLPANQEGLRRTIAFVGAMSRDTNTITTALDEPNLVAITINGTYAPAAVTIATTLTNTLIVTAMTDPKVLAAGLYGVVLNKSGDNVTPDTDWLASA